MSPVSPKSLDSKAEEARLFAQCRLHDEEAWASFIARFEGAIYRRALLILHNREDAEDASAETFERIYRSIDQFRADSLVLPWVLRIAQNTAISFLRRKQCRPPAISLNGLHQDLYPLEIEIPDRTAGPLDRVIARESGQRLAAAIEHLPAHLQGAFSYHVLRGMPLSEVADRIGVPIGTVKSRIARARKRLRERFDLN